MTREIIYKLGGSTMLAVRTISFIDRFTTWGMCQARPTRLGDIDVASEQSLSKDLSGIQGGL